MPLVPGKAKGGNPDGAIRCSITAETRATACGPSSGVGMFIQVTSLRAMVMVGPSDLPNGPP